MQKLIASLLLAVLALSPLAKMAEAAPVNPATPMISITFDDGFASTYTNALPLLNQRGMKATAYVTSNMIGQPGMMTWAQVKALQDQYGWEIGSHTVTHPELPTLTAAQIQTEVQTSKTALEKQGLKVTSFASPFGAYDNRVLTESLKIYNSHRGFWDRESLNVYPYNRAVLQAQSIEQTTTLAQVQTWVNQAKANKQWLNLVVHEVQPKLDPNYEYVVTTANFTKMLDYIKSSGVQVVTDNNTLTKPGFNLVANPSFDQGLAAGWTTDNATAVKLDVANHGSYPSSTNSIVMQGASSVSPAPVASSRMNLVAQGLTLTDSKGVAKTTFAPNEAIYVKAVLGNLGGTQVPAGMTTEIYANKPTEVPAGTKDAPEFAINHTGYWAANGGSYVYGSYTGGTRLDQFAGSVRSFKQATPGTYTARVYVDALNKSGEFNETDNQLTATYTITGTASTPTVAPTTPAAHLFSSPISAQAATTYELQAFANTDLLASGELGFYVDEYDAQGTWISGQRLGSVVSGKVTYFTALYQPTSATVATFKLQADLPAGAVGKVYLDNFELYNLTPQTAPTPTPSTTPVPTATPTPAATPTPVANSKMNLVAQSLVLTDSKGVTKTSFAPNEAIYVKAVLGSAGSAQVPAGITTEIYANRPAAVAANTKDTPEFAINHTGYWPATPTNYTYGSYTGASRLDQFAGTVRSFKQATPGTYTARIYVDALNKSGESNEADNQMTAAYTITGTVPTPTPSVTPTPAPVTSLLLNGSFEQLTGAFATNWTNDGTGLSIDTTAKGGNGNNALSLKTATTAVHAFSDMIAVDSTATYAWSQRVSAAYSSGEFGYYIDEYDANGNWVSGQWKGSITGSTTGVTTFTYQPTSAQVKSVKLQYYAIAGTTMVLYVDAVTFAKQ